MQNYNPLHHNKEIILSLFQQINLINVRLKTIDPEAFCGLQKLKTLKLSHNKLTTPPILRPIESMLIELAIDNNFLGEFPVDYFQNFSRLSVVDLIDNGLTVLPTFSWLEQSLKLIYLNDNRLVTLDGLTSHGHYTSLIRIYANHNEITTFNITHLINIPKLKTLKLIRNNLTSLGDFTLYYDGRLSVRDNPWHCDAELSWVSSFNQDTFSLTCFTPQCYAGRIANNLGEYREEIHKKRANTKCADFISIAQCKTAISPEL